MYNYIFKKIINYLLLVIIVFYLMSFVSCAKKPENEKITLVVWTQRNTEEIKKYYEEEKALLSEVMPNVNLDVRMVPSEQFKTLIKTALASNDAPDVFFYWSYEDAYFLARNGLVYDLNEFSTNSYWAKLNHPALKSFSLNDKQYGIPDHLISKYLFYNKKYFADNNLSIPKTYDELIALSLKIRSINPEMIPVAFGNSESWPGVHYISTLNQKFVGETQIDKDYFLTEEEDKLFTDQGYVNALQALLDMQEKGVFNNAPNSLTPQAPIELFINGKAAMVYSGTWNITLFDKNLQGNYGFFRFPPITQGKGNQNYLFMLAEGMMVSSKTKNPKVANDYLDFILSSKLQALRTDIGFLPIAPVKDEDAKGKLSDVALAVTEDIAKAEGAIYILDVALDNNISDLYLTGIQEVLNKSKTPVQLMKEIHDKAVEIKKSKK